MVLIVNPKNPEDKYEYYVDPALKHYLDTHVKRDLEQADKDYLMLID